MTEGSRAISAIRRSAGGQEEQSLARKQLNHSTRFRKRLRCRLLGQRGNRRQGEQECENRAHAAHIVVVAAFQNL